MPEVSKTAADCIKVSRTVLAALTTHAEPLTQGLHNTLFSGDQPEHFDENVLVQALGDALQRATDKVALTDQQLAAERSDDFPPRGRRSVAVLNLRGNLIGTRDLLESTYGPEVAQCYSLQGETPTEPELLQQHALVVLQLLRTRPVTEAPLRPGIRLDLPELATTLEQSIRECRDALQAIRTEARELEQALTARDRALAEWSEIYQSVATTVTGLFHLAGLPELADRVRPTARRRAGLTEAEDLTDPAATDAEPTRTP